MAEAAPPLADSINRYFSALPDVPTLLIARWEPGRPRNSNLAPGIALCAAGRGSMAASGHAVDACALEERCAGLEWRHLLPAEEDSEELRQSKRLQLTKLLRVRNATITCQEARLLPLPPTCRRLPPACHRCGARMRLRPTCSASNADHGNSSAKYPQQPETAAAGAGAAAAIRTAAAVTASQHQGHLAERSPRWQQPG